MFILSARILSNICVLCHCFLRKMELTLNFLKKLWKFWCIYRKNTWKTILFSKGTAPESLPGILLKIDPTKEIFSHAFCKIAHSPFIKFRKNFCKISLNVWMEMPMPIPRCWFKRFTNRGFNLNPLNGKCGSKNQVLF